MIIKAKTGYTTGYVSEPIIAGEDYIFGSQINAGGRVLRPDGDWRAFLPKYENQKKNGFESSGCTIFHTLNPIEIIFEEKFGINDEDYSERFTATLSDTSPTGNSPKKVAQTIRHLGVIPEPMLPFDKKVKTFEDFSRAPITGSMYGVGKKWLNNWTLTHDIVPSSREAIMEALKFSPLGVSVYAWVEENGIYHKPDGVRDTHWTSLVYLDNDFYYVFDSYEPYIKKLHKDFRFELVKRYNVERKIKNRNWLFDIISNLWK